MKPRHFLVPSFLLVVALLIPGRVLPTAAHSQAINPNEPNILTFTFPIPPVQITRGDDGYDQVRLEGFDISGSPGDPKLPARTYHIALPPDVVWDSIKVDAAQTQTTELAGEHVIAPAPPGVTWIKDHQLVLWDKNADSIVDGKNTQVYRNDAYFPPSPLSSVRHGQMRKWRVLSLLVSPLQYNPVTGKLRQATQVQVRVTFDRAVSVDRQQLQLELSDTFMDDRAAQMFYNYEQARAWYPVTARPAGVSTQANYVIITSRAIVNASAALDRFVAHKQAQGYTVQVVMEDKYAGLTGQWPDRMAEKIRQFLKNNSPSIQYVLLIGNPTPYDPDNPSATVGDVPMKMCWPAHLGKDDEGNPLGQNIPTDYYYANLYGNWHKDSNGDGDEYCGELGDDDGGMSFFPDVYVGRIPVYRNVPGWETTLDTILDKTIAYEDSGDLGWRRSALLPMSFLASNTDGAFLARAMQKDYLNPAGYTSHTLYQYTGNWDSACYSDYSSNHDLVPDAVRDEWESIPYGLVTWWAHGNSQSAEIGYEGCSGGDVLTSDNAGSLHDDHPAIVFSVSCENGYPEDTNNLAYALLKRGAVAAIGSSRNSIFYFGDFVPSRAGADNASIGYYVMQRVVNGATLGRALYDEEFQMSNASSWDTNKVGNWMNFNLYGDPTLSINDGHPWIPYAPTGLQAKAIQYGSIDLTWTDNSDNEDRFIVQRSPNGSTGWITIADNLPPDRTAFTDLGPSCGQVVYYRVRATNPEGTSTSNVVSVTAQSPDDYEPNDDHIRARWIATTGAVQHHSFHTAGDADWVHFWAYPWNAYTMATSSLGSQVNTILDLFDRDGTTLLTSNDNCTTGPASCIKNWRPAAMGIYYLRVRDVNGQGGCTGYTYDLAVTENANTSLPAAPSNLVAQNPTNYSIGLSWSDNSSNEDGFRIERWGVSQSGPYRVPGWISVGAVGPNVNQWTDTNLTCNTKQTYRVYAYNAAGQSSYTAVASASTVTQDRWEPDGTPAQAHTIVVGGAPERHTFHVAGDQDWVKLSAATDRVYTITTSNLGYNADTVLQLYDQDGATLLESNDDCGGHQSCIKRWKPPATGTYYVQVRNRLGGGGCPGYEYDLAVTGTRGSIVGRPDLMPAAPSHSAVHLAWAYREPDAGFVVERRPTSGKLLPWLRMPWQRITQVAPGVTQYDDTQLGCGTRYEYRLRALTSGGVSGYSQIVSVTTTLRDAFEPDNVYTQAHSITPNGLPQYHNLYGSPSIDVDWIKFLAAKNQIYTITLNGIMTTTVISNTMLQLYDTNGTTLLATAGFNPYFKGVRPYIRFQANPPTFFATYYIRVSNARGGGCPGYDYAVSVVNSQYRAALPAPPFDLRVTQQRPDQIALGWFFRGTANGFDIQRRYGNGWLRVGQVASGVTTFADDNVSCGVPYEYRVAAIGVPGNSDYVSLAVPTLPCLYPVAYLPMVVRNP